MTAPAVLYEYPRPAVPAALHVSHAAGAATRERVVGDEKVPLSDWRSTSTSHKPPPTPRHGAPTFRVPVDGPEGHLVNGFVEWCADRIGAIVPRGCGVTLLREPRLPSGFPDLVFVVWHERTAAQWRPERASLAAGDLQLLQYLREVGSAPDDSLAMWGGARVAARLDRLHAARLVWRRGARWRPRALRASFALRSILAVEAKVSQWATALDQAAVNTWFASQSFVLLPHVPTREAAGDALLTRAAAQGVGVWVANDRVTSRGAAWAPRRVLDAARHDLPRSYASWLVNEWVCRAVHAGALT